MCFQLGPFSSWFELGVRKQIVATGLRLHLRASGGGEGRCGDTGSAETRGPRCHPLCPADLCCWSSRLRVRCGGARDDGPAAIGLQLGLPCGTPSLLKAPYRAKLPAPVSCASGFSRWTWAGRGWGPLCHSRPFSPIPSYALFRELSGKKKKKALGKMT